MAKKNLKAEAGPVVENRMVTETARSERPALVKVRAVRDLMEGEYRQPGDVFEVTMERAKALGGLVVVL